MLNERLSMLATGTTVTIMFSSLLWLQPFLTTWSVSYQIAGSVAAGLASVGIYRLLAGGLLWLFQRWQLMRKLMLGRSFLEGTWVGHYVHGGEHRFTVEHIDQSSGETIIRGREFDAAGGTRASWASDTVSIDTIRMHLVYAYTCKVFDRKHVQEGLGVFSMVCEVPKKPANKLDGYAVDLIDGDRDPNTEYKIAKTETRDKIAIAEARKIFGVPET
jgi:hypothetical protein